MPRHVILGIDLTTAGARALRTPGAPVARPFDGERFVRLMRTADRGLLDLVVLDEPFLLHPSRGRVSGRLDPAVAAARVAPLTDGIGLVAALDTMHLEASHVAAAIASIDRASDGRSGWQVGCPAGVALTDERWPVQAVADAERVVRAWDQDDAGGAGADGLVRVDHDGIRFAVRRPAGGRTALPQGRPPIVMRVHTDRCASAAAATADVVRLVAPDGEQVRALRSAVHDAAVAIGRDPRELSYLVESLVVLATDRESALTRLAMLEALEGPDVGAGALVVAGTPAELTQLVTDWVDDGVADGFLLRPAALDADLDAVVRGLVPSLQSRGRFRAARTASTLRETLGLAPTTSSATGREHSADDDDDAARPRTTAGLHPPAAADDGPVRSTTAANGGAARRPLAAGPALAGRTTKPRSDSLVSAG